ncbi:DUF1353 domain-containing protein [Methylococcus sp. EFPC2]|uniref:DUF1353 domain-containing protein n=1 Tax=Methylococcus sp. EFPC2 TaxID=2812648 RepID=UPI001967C938|nr:DUF1353 domain-containing protein [Methylococcus sp. EFPC2]QSA96490.1 DUF1353 domain-containing protein [Methylococcus sp. EFPC2]
MKCIAYKDGYKYQLKESYEVLIDIKPEVSIATSYIGLDAQGKLSLREGYAWDGPSGPTIDTLTFMRGSLIHDALYQLMREEHLDKDKYREQADRLLQKICLEDGMGALRAWWVYQGVKRFGDPSADPASKRPLTRAPNGCQL